ncbi:MAG: MaoC/PaaZ C-terminal domain-containing protein [Desulfomonilia bacterium]|nr:MaoC/PaaZ C-terminal domain-containing protein [Desulfomonilia bacterium]
MELSSRFVGIPLKEYATTVTWRDTMNYAAATGDSNQCYLNDERPGGVIAPPMFAVALTWPISERIWDYFEVEDFPREILLTQVHYTEHLRFYRMIRPGDSLKIQGRIAAIVPHKAGTHIVIRFDARDSTSELVFTEHIGGMMRGVECSDSGRGEEDLPAVPAHSGTDTPLWSVPIPVDELASFVYDGCTRIVFPIHTSVHFAHQVGLPGIIFQGTATLAYAVRELVNRESDADPRNVAAISCRFTGMVRPGEEIVVRLLHRERSDGTHLHFDVLNAEGRKAISHGYVFLQNL